MGSFRNRNALAAASARLMIASVSDSIVAFTPTPTPHSRSSLSHTHSHCVWYTPPRSPRPRSSRSRALGSFGFFLVWTGLVPPVWPLDPLLGLLLFRVYPCNPVYPRCLDPSVLEFSLSLHRHPSMCILCSSRFTSYNKQTSTRKKHSPVHIVLSSRFMCWNEKIKALTKNAA
jgi:hypothetical protein